MTDRFRLKPQIPKNFAAFNRTQTASERIRLYRNISLSFLVTFLYSFASKLNFIYLFYEEIL